MPGLKMENTVEEWRKIPGFEEYEASNMGRVRNRSGAILSPVNIGPKRKQYQAVYVGGGRNSYKKVIHRLVLSAFIGPPPDGHLACHKNDIQTDNRLENLYWGTPKQNVQDQKRSGRFSAVKAKLGEESANAKYSNDLVRILRGEYTGDRGCMTMLSKKYKIPMSTLYQILKNDSRKSG